MSKKPVKSTLTVGGATFVSRIFGYARDAIIFIVFGANAGTDAFFVAFRIPNFLRRLFAEGAFSQAFVPVMTAHLHDSENDFRRLIDHVTGLLSIILLIITTLGVLASPWLIHIFAPGFDDPAQQLLASDMLKITFPYLLFISLTALSGSILNIRQKFAVPALTPVLLNLSLIGAAIWLSPKMENPVTALAWGVFIAGIAQLLFQIPYLLKAHSLPVPKLSGAKQGVDRILKLMLPAMFGSSIVQINLLINTIIASYLIAGSISWLYMSDRFVELPIALFGIATATVILPMLSKQYVSKQHQEFDQTMQWALKVSLLISIPAMLGLAVLSGPILFTLVQYREFSLFDTQMVTLSLMASSLGLPAYIFIKVLAPGFYSRQDTKTPVKIGVLVIFINISLSLLFIWLLPDIKLPGAHAGLSLVTSFSAYVNASLLYILLRRAKVLNASRQRLTMSLKIIISSIVMLLSLWWINPDADVWASWNSLTRLGSLMGLIIIGITIYTSLLLVLGLRPSQFRLQSN
ncbi:MAG: murein biosynthesis integral membrane protein MurJ [Gammaproteobacteria bacterium]|nr:murein biosynthesis integral membrane protein MurJ [Gammaproteobacteria bacterium]